jgi:nickel transport protein
MKKMICLAAGFLAVLLSVPQTTLAHKVNLFAYADAGKIFTESYFSDGKFIAGGKMMVYDSQNRLILEGVTDDQGRFSFDIPQVDDLTLVVDAGMGHKNRFVLKKADVEAGR